MIIYTAEHGIQNDGIPFIKQEGNTARVNIGNNVYLGARVIILSGVTIGDNVVVGAGSVVNKNIPSNEIWAGIPARKIKNI